MLMDNIKRVCLWSGPRNISTALMYSFAQRNDTKVYDEPLYAHYLSNTEADEYHPGAEDVLTTLESNAGRHFDPELVDIFFSIIDIIRSVQNRYADDA